MIPLEYRLREPVRVERRAEGTWQVVCGSPLVAARINAAAARFLAETREGASVSALATRLRTTEERALLLGERFRAWGILEVRCIPDAASQQPSVTIVVPTRDRAADLDESLRALALLDYPRERLELIVVDDGSSDPGSVERVVARHRGRLLVNARSRGPAYSRNQAAGQAGGEILAFIDSDCVAEEDWLKELTPYFSWDRVGAVGGRALGYYNGSRLDRYEQVASPLDMGRHLRLEGKGDSTFYVPTCNLLVRRSTYQGVGGLREELTVGEDVDLCWRLREQGHVLVYAPEGVVRHKHRNAAGSMLRRRMEYGTSEATLYALHAAKRKRFPSSPAPLATAILVLVALVRRRAWLWPVCLAPPLVDAVRRAGRLRRADVPMPVRSVAKATLRGHLSMLYFVYFHLVRYHLITLTVLAWPVAGLRRLLAFSFLYAGTVDYVLRRPRLSYPEYLAVYLAEHLAYQAGVIAGCVRVHTPRPYLLGLQAGRPLSLPEGDGQRRRRTAAGPGSTMTPRACDLLKPDAENADS